MKKLLFIILLLFIATGCSNNEVKTTKEERKMLANEYYNQIKEVEPIVVKSVDINYIDKVTKTHITIHTFNGDFNTEDKCRSYIHKLFIKLTEHEKSYNILGNIRFYFWDSDKNIIHDYEMTVPSKDQWEDYLIHSKNYVKKWK